MIIMRAHKPKALKVEAIYKRMAGSVERTIDLADKQFAKTYRTFDRKPVFVKRMKLRSDGIYGEYWTVDENYVRLSLGVKGPYKIPKAGPGLLVFPSGYKAKTRPTHLASYQGGSFGEPVFFYGQLDHPGFDPRNFDKTVSKYVFPWFSRWAQEAIRIGARESGHSI